MNLRLQKTLITLVTTQLHQFGWTFLFELGTVLNKMTKTKRETFSPYPAILWDCMLFQERKLRFTKTKTMSQSNDVLHFILLLTRKIIRIDPQKMVKGKKSICWYFISLTRPVVTNYKRIDHFFRTHEFGPGHELFRRTCQFSSVQSLSRV